jgi:hypothetical protein
VAADKGRVKGGKSQQPKAPISSSATEGNEGLAIMTEIAASVGSD